MDLPWVVQSQAQSTNRNRICYKRDNYWPDFSFPPSFSFYSDYRQVFQQQKLLLRIRRKDWRRKKTQKEPARNVLAPWLLLHLNCSRTSLLQIALTVGLTLWKCSNVHSVTLALLLGAANASLNLIPHWEFYSVLSATWHCWRFHDLPCNCPILQSNCCPVS